MGEEKGIWKIEAVKSYNSWIHPLCHFLASKEKNTSDVPWGSHSLLEGNRNVHKLETGCISVQVLRGKIPSRSLRRDFEQKQQIMISSAVFLFPLTLTNNAPAFHIGLFLIVKLWKFEKMHCIIFSEGNSIHARHWVFTMKPKIEASKPLTGLGPLQIPAPNLHSQCFKGAFP